MHVSQHKHRDFFQNLAIVILSITAVLLLLQTQFYNLEDGQDGPLSSFLEPTQAASPVISAPADLRDFPVPVRLLVSDSYGRRGELTLTTASEAFLPMRPLLGDALRSSHSFSPCEEALFRKGLSQPSVCFDFLNPVPLFFLADSMGVSAPKEDLTVRQMLLFAENDNVLLCLKSGTEFHFSQTDVSVNALDRAVKNNKSANVFLALDNQEDTMAFSRISPYSLLPMEPAELPILDSSCSLEDSDLLLSSLQMNTHTNNRYTESSGTEVIMEGDRVVQVHPDGTVFYESGGDSALSIQSEHTPPSIRDTVMWSMALLDPLLGNFSGQASFFLSDVQQSGEVITLHFDYHMDGVPILFSDGCHAAEIVISHGAVSSLQLRFRTYSRSTDSSLLLPLRQTLAISASKYKGAELSLCYADRGEAAVSAAWFSD